MRRSGRGRGRGRGKGSEAVVDVALLILSEVEDEDEVGSGGVLGDEVKQQLRETEASGEDDKAVLLGQVVENLTMERKNGRGRGGGR